MLAVGLVVTGAIGAGPAAADTVNFPYVAPTEQTPNPYATFTVPAGVTQATFDLYGAQGAGGADQGGKGAHVTSTLSVTPGTVYRVYVGGVGSQPAGGYNGGGSGGSAGYYPAGFGGGGATDVRVGAFGTADRVLVAAGGGGSGRNDLSNQAAIPGGASGADGDGDGGGHSGPSGGGAGPDPYDFCPSATDGTADSGGNGSDADAHGFCVAGGGGGAGLVGGGGGGYDVTGDGRSGGGGGGSSKTGGGTLVDGANTGNGSASVTYTAAPDASVKVDGPLTPFQSDGSSRFKLGTVLEIRVKVSQGGQLITGLKPQVNIVRTGAPSGSQTPNVAFLSRSADSGKVMRYSAQFGQYQFYAATKKSQFNGGKDLATGRYRVDVTDPAFPGGAHKVARNFAIVP